MVLPACVLGTARRRAKHGAIVRGHARVRANPLLPVRHLQACSVFATKPAPVTVPPSSLPLHTCTPVLAHSLPAAKVVAILSPSPKREHVVGLLQLGAAPSAPSASAYQSAPAPTCYLVPLDPRLPRCVVRPAELKNLPEALWEELRAGQEGGEGGEAGSRWGAAVLVLVLVLVRGVCWRLSCEVTAGHTHRRGT